MPFYSVPRLGTGNMATRDWFRPAIPAGVSWVGQDSGPSYVIFTPANLPAAVGRVLLSDNAALQNAAATLGITLEELRSWRIG